MPVALSYTGTIDTQNADFPALRAVIFHVSIKTEFPEYTV
jgi:hypothetical protein